MTVHVIGGGMAGLAAAVACVGAGHAVALYEASPQFGGRCRSYNHDAFGCEVDNGAHAVLANNESVAKYLQVIGAQDRLRSFEPSFVDLRTQASWKLRVPNPLDVISSVLGRPFQPSPRALESLWDPLSASALNTPFAEADPQLLAPIMRAMLGWNGLRRGLMLPRVSLSHAYINPALDWLRARGAVIRSTHPLRGVSVANHRICRLKFEGGEIDVHADDSVILAIPWWSPVLPLVGIDSAELPASPILNAHFHLDTATGAHFIGLIGGLSQWLWARDHLASVTVSAADAVMSEDSDVLAARIWAEIAPILNRTAAPVPGAHIVKERRATLRHLRGINARRPGPRTTLANVTLAGDWVSPDLPCTLESAIQSGFLAAEHAGRPPLTG